MAMADQRRDSEHRPSPEALLEAARREEGRVGKLRIFVGAAPGVGKTYEMLQQAHARRKDGYDVVVGIVETHGRKETEALLEGLEVVPRRRIEYKGQWLEEMDLDAIIARRPQIVLVDELAHTNAEGSRHPKRYLDVEELMSHGIDVYTTVNIQHIESLNDVVAQITHVRVRETVPDAVFDRADAVELVDLTPDDLIQRLKEGKVYVPEQAERALEHFFSPANLTALRELALRRTAERVDEQLLTEMQAHAIQGPWAAGERILVCISEDPRCAGLVRYAKRLADRLHGPWVALYVEGRRSLQLSEEERDRIADTLRLAEALGGEAITLPAGDRHIADDVIGYAQANNVTQIVIGKSARSRWFEILHGSVVHDLVRRSGNISVHVIAGDTIAGEPIPKKSVRAAEHDDPFDPRPYVFALVAVALALGCARTDPAMVRRRKCRSGFSDCRRRRRRALRPVAVAAGERRVFALLQFFLSAADLHLHHHRSDQRRGIRLLHAGGDHRLQCRRARPHPGGGGDGPRACHRVALFVQPQARRRRNARRRALGDGLSDRADAESAGRAAAAGARLDRGEEPAIRRRTCSTMPTSPRRNGRGRTIAPPAAAPIRFPAPSACSCRCTPGAAPSASWASTATSPARC